MGKFINDDTIKAIIFEKCENVQRVINCNLIISPIESKVYLCKYENIEGNFINYKIPEEIYIEYDTKISKVNV